MHSVHHICNLRNHREYTKEHRERTSTKLWYQGSRPIRYRDSDTMHPDPVVNRECICNIDPISTILSMILECSGGALPYRSNRHSRYHRFELKIISRHDPMYKSLHNRIPDDLAIHFESIISHCITLEESNKMNEQIDSLNDTVRVL